MLRSHLQPEKGEDQIRRTMIVGATAVKAAANTLTSQVDPLLIVTRNLVVDRTMIWMIITRVVDILRKVDINIKSHGLGRDLGLGLSHLILRHLRKDVVKT